MVEKVYLNLSDEGAQKSFSYYYCSKRIEIGTLVRI